MWKIGNRQISPVLYRFALMNIWLSPLFQAHFKKKYAQEWENIASCFPGCWLLGKEFPTKFCYFYQKPHRCNWGDVIRSYMLGARLNNVPPNTIRASIGNMTTFRLRPHIIQRRYVSGTSCEFRVANKFLSRTTRPSPSKILREVINIFAISVGCSRFL